MYLKLITTLFVSILAIASLTAQEQDRATVQLRDGTKVEGRIEELAQGTLFLRVSQHDQRRIPASNIALIDRKGAAAGLPDTEIREARGADHVLLLAGGSSVRGRLAERSRSERQRQEAADQSAVGRRCRIVAWLREEGRQECGRVFAAEIG